MLEVHRNEDFILTTISHLRRVMSAVASSKFWISTLHVSTHYTEDHRQFPSAVLQTPAFLFSSENVCLPQSSAVLVLRPAQTCERMRMRVAVPRGLQYWQDLPPRGLKGDVH